MQIDETLTHQASTYEVEKHTVVEGNMEAQKSDKEIPNKNMNDRKASLAKLGHVDSLSLEAGRISSIESHAFKQTSWVRTLILAFQSLGIIYGDIGTSPLYVYDSMFTDGITNTQDLLGCLSLIIYTIALIPFFKYILVVLWANDNGDGGTFALYSLICRHSKVGLIPNQQPEDREISNYKLDTSNRSKRAEKIKHKLENSKFAKLILFTVTIMATSMVIGDGILTPSISVLSAVVGIKTKIPSLSQGAVVGISIGILIILFAVQRFGTDRVGYTFAPIIFVWFLLIGVIGLYNLIKYDIGVLRAFNPKYIVDYMKRNGKDGWISLGGIFMCITGVEAMFADLGHFNVQAVQISFSFVTFPALVCAYSGQTAYLIKFPEEIGSSFYSSIPDPIFWPTFVVVVLAAIIASQTMISGAYSVIQQSQSLGCFPSVKVIHTSAKYEGQVYIPEINYFLMISCVIVCAAFRTTDNIGHAYGIAVCFVMLITTCMVSLIMLVIWKTSILWIALFVLIFCSIEIVYLSSMLTKFVQGGFLPLALSLFLMIIMGIWHYTHRKRYLFEIKNKVSSEYVRELVSKRVVSRIPGVSLIYSELVEGVPPIFSHVIANIPHIHSVVVFVSIKSIPISKVALDERFLLRQIQPKEFRIFRCVVRYGYNDVIGEPYEFEQQLVEQLKQFIRDQNNVTYFEEEVGGVSDAEQTNNNLLLNSQQQSNSDHFVKDGKDSSNQNLQGVEEEISFVQRAMEKSVVYMLGEAEVVAEPNSSIFKKIVVNHIYNFLRKNFRQGQNLMAIPRSRLLKVGMTYEI